MADEQFNETPPADAPPADAPPADTAAPAPEKHQSEAAKNREIHQKAEHEHRHAQHEAAIKRQEELPEGVVVPNPTRAPSPVTHDRFAEEDEGATGEP
jgi:hypothetical protein